MHCRLALSFLCESLLKNIYEKFSRWLRRRNARVSRYQGKIAPWIAPTRACAWFENKRFDWPSVSFSFVTFLSINLISSFCTQFQLSALISSFCTQKFQVFALFEINWHALSQSALRICSGTQRSVAVMSFIISPPINWVKVTSTTVLLKMWPLLRRKMKDRAYIVRAKISPGLLFDIDGPVPRWIASILPNWASCLWPHSSSIQRRARLVWKSCHFGKTDAFHLQNSRSGPPFHDRIIYEFCCIHWDYRLIYLCILHVLFLILFCDFILCVLFPSGGG